MADRSRNDSEAQAILAFEKAQQLLRKHHLEMSHVMADLEADESRASSTDYITISEEVGSTFKANTLPRWMFTTLLATKILTTTHPIVRRTSRPGKTVGQLQIVFVGDKTDVLVAAELFNFLRKTISSLASKHKREIQGTHTNWRSFAEGCSTRIKDRAVELEVPFDPSYDDNFNADDPCSIDNFNLDEDEEYEEVDDEAINGNELQLYSDFTNTKIEKIREYLDTLNMSEEKEIKVRKLDTCSYEVGREEGEFIPLKILEKVDG